MIRNYLKVALRNIRKHRLYALLNIAGLGVGLASFFVIFLFLQNERSYDQFHVEKDRTFRVINESSNSGKFERVAGLTAALAPIAAAEIPEIESFSRMDIYPKPVILNNTIDSVQVFSSLAVEEGFFDFFTLTLSRGSLDAWKTSPNSVFVSKSVEDDFFGGNALKSTLKLNGTSFQVEGVFEDLPQSSSYKAQIIAPFMTVNARRVSSMKSWGTSYFDQTLFLLADGADPSLVERKLKTLHEQQLPNNEGAWKLQSMNEIHFSLGIIDSIGEKTDRQYIYIFTLVAAFILICSVFNYVSLALSQSMERTKEIGVRRVVGANSKQLYRQFISESVLFVLLGFVTALILVELFLPELETLLGRTLDRDLTNTPGLLLLSIAFSLVIAILSALYPALVSTRLKVTSIFRRSTGQWSSQGLINGISVFQIGVFMVLILVAFTSNRQMHFMQNENLGFDKENQLVVNLFSRATMGKTAAFKNKLNELPGVLSTSLASSIPSRVMGSQKYRDYDFSFVNFDVDSDYLETMGMTLKEGRGFTPEDRFQDNLVLVNQATVDRLDFEGTAVGKTINAGKNGLRIIGVVNDFHWVSKKEPIGPTLFRVQRPQPGVAVVKLAPGNVRETMDQIEAEYKALTDGEEMGYFFLDDQINAQYKQERVMTTMINTFTVIAALVAFIGLFGIAGYAARRRQKEIGIRKVLGAGFINIQLLLNKSNLWKLGLATLVSVPLAMVWMQDWLSSFAYRIETPFSLLVLAFVLATLVVVTTASFHSIRAFLLDPVKILKDE